MKKIENQKWGVENNYHLPEEIVDIILLKLSVKDVIKCSAVCKSWNSLVKSPSFIRTHLNNQTAGDVSGLLLLGSSQSNDLHWDNPAALFGQYSKLLHPIHNSMSSDWNKDMRSRVVGTCNGLVCLSVTTSISDPWPPVVLWNPSIRKFGFLPCPPSGAVKCRWDVSYNFCYDSRIDDYKVVRILKEFEPDGKVEVEVWSLATGTWKTLSNVPAYFSPDTIDVCYNNFVNGAFHWVHEMEMEMEEYFVVALDMVDESFRNVKIPQDIVGEDSDELTISRYHGDGDQLWLSLFEIQGDTSFDVWVMKEYGVVESWTKLFNVCLLGSPEEQPYIIEPFSLTKSGQVVVRLNNRYLFNRKFNISFKSYDPEDKQFKDFGNQGCEYYFMDSFVESLVLLGQTNVFSY